MVDNTTKILVIAPHADDESFGCGGTIAKWAYKGAYTHLVVMAIGEGCPDEIRYEECMNASYILGIKQVTVLFNTYEAKLDTLAQKSIVTELDRVIDEHPYSYIFIPYPSHHKDHKITHEASLAALRLGAHVHIPNILMYEYTYPDYSTPGGKFYVDITGTCHKKIQAISTYKSRIRQFPHPCSPLAAQTLAEMRGLAIQANYAEMFHVIQMIGD